jgi:hypothetical protein
MAEVGRSYAMQLEKVGLRITEPSGRGHLGLIPGGPKTAQQPGFGPTLERGEQGQGPTALELLAKTTAGEQQGHQGNQIF